MRGDHGLYPRGISPSIYRCRLCYIRDMYGVHNHHAWYISCFGDLAAKSTTPFFMAYKVPVGLGMKRGSTFSLHSRPLVAYSCIPLAWDQAYPIRCPTSVPVM